MLLTFCVGITPRYCFGQVEGPPSLLLGLTGLTGEKGTIDVALLSEIIAEKQSELKKEFIKRQFYDNLHQRNYVVWEFSYNSLDMLFNTSNTKIIEQKLLEYAANLALVYSFTETYLQVSDRLCNSDLEAVVRTWGRTGDEDTLASDFHCPDSTSKGVRWLSTLRRDDGSGLNVMLIDLVFDVLRENQTLNNLGFFQTQLPLGEEFYKSHSQYHLAKGDLRIMLDSLRSRMETEVSVLIDYYYVIKMAVEKDIDLRSFDKLINPGFKEKDSLKQMLQRDPSKRDSLVQDSLRLEKVKEDSLAKAKTILYDDLAKLSEVINASNQQKDSLLSVRITEALNAFLDFEKRAGDNKFRVEDLYFLEEKTYPLLVKLVTEYGFNSNYLNIAAQYRSLILSSLLRQIVVKLDKLPKNEGENRVVIPQFNAIDYKNFVDILTHIYQLDRADTYKAYLQTLSDISGLFADPNLSRLIFNITDLLQKYTTLDKEKNAIRVDVEEIILQLYRKYEARQNNRVNFYFSLGLNQVFNAHYDDGYEIVEDSARMNSIAFASEKIGVKVKLFDFRKRRAFDYGEVYNNTRITDVKSKSPIVSDVYALLYGSGLLYNIVNTTTNENFDRPIIGLGVGSAFFNSLDFNVFVNFPLMAGESLRESLQRRQWFGFSFDIKIGDYITRVREKRIAKQKTPE
jgi:hypothetical protein